MFCTVKLNSEILVGTVVQFDASSQMWSVALNHNETIGVISEAASQDDEGQWWARVTFAGISFAIADRAIPDQGGKLNVANGRVYVDNTTDTNGIVAPVSRGQTSRLVNDLVMVDIR